MRDGGTLKVARLGQKLLSPCQYIGSLACMPMSHLPQNNVSKDMGFLVETTLMFVYV